MRLLIMLLTCLLLLSCNNATQNNLAAADSIIINFIPQEKGVVAKSIATSNTTAIKKMINYITDTSGKVVTCTTEGNLKFYQKNVLVETVNFNYTNAACRFFRMVNGKQTQFQMNDEAAAFLQSLALGKSWY